jgi:hypothetical protein
MALSTYPGIQAAIASLLNRQDLTAYIPDWITMCEAELNTKLTGRQMTCRQTINITSDTYPLPCDFGGVISFGLNTTSGYKLEYVPVDALDTAYYAPAQPCTYSIAGSNFVFSPSPNDTYGAILRYRKLLPKLSENGENWLLSRYPNAYLYGSAIHSAPFLMDDQRIGMWQAKFDQIVGDINEESRRESQGARLQTRSGVCA